MWLIRKHAQKQVMYKTCKFFNDSNVFDSKSVCMYHYNYYYRYDYYSAYSIAFGNTVSFYTSIFL